MTGLVWASVLAALRPCMLALLDSLCMAGLGAGLCWVQVLLLNYIGGVQNRKVADMSEDALVAQVGAGCCC